MENGNHACIVHGDRPKANQIMEYFTLCQTDLPIDIADQPTSLTFLSSQILDSQPELPFSDLVALANDAKMEITSTQPQSDRVPPYISQSVEGAH